MQIQCAVVIARSSKKIEFSRILYVTDDDKFSVKGPKNASQGERNLNGPAYCNFAKEKITTLACKLKNSFAKKCLLPLFKNESVLPNFPSFTT